MGNVATQDLLSRIEAATQAASSAEEVMWTIVRHLHANLPKYHWVGFYMIDNSGSQPMLNLGPFAGAATPHTRIALNQGICGAAAASGDTLVVDDVNKDPRYLACSIETKSEIVAPVFVNGTVVGELDIDSHIPAAFNPEDRVFVEQCAAILGKFLERNRR
jgi:L-methionine (R)-S-oxide reductase